MPWILHFLSRLKFHEKSLICKEILRENSFHGRKNHKAKLSNIKFGTNLDFLCFSFLRSHREQKLITGNLLFLSYLFSSALIIAYCYTKISHRWYLFRYTFVLFVCFSFYFAHSLLLTGTAEWGYNLFPVFSLKLL